VRIELHDDVALEIAFDDRSVILVSVRPEHYARPEAVNIHLRDKTSIVF